jgi:hypothetical protein
MKRTFGEPSLALSGIGQAGLDWSTVRLITPEKVLPGLYSFKGIKTEPPLLFSDKLCYMRKPFAPLNKFVIVTQCLHNSVL